MPRRRGRLCKEDFGIDENFVRKNLRNKKGVGRQHGKKRPRVDEGREAFGGSEANDFKKYSNNGDVDALELSLEAVARNKDIEKVSGVGPLNKTLQTPSSSASSAVLPRGLDPSRAFGSKLTSRWSCAGRSKKEIDLIPEHLLIQHAPLCSGHHLPSALLRVRKAGPNTGRRFYGCMSSAEERCTFFMWADDNPALLQDTLQQEAKVEQSWDKYALHLYKSKISKFSVVELKALLRNLTSRKEFICADLKTKPAVNPKLVLGGTREELLERIMKEEERQLLCNLHLVGLGHEAASGLRSAASMDQKEPEDDKFCNTNRRKVGGSVQDQEILLSDSEDEEDEGEDEEESEGGSDYEELNIVHDITLPPLRKGVHERNLLTSSAPEEALQRCFGFSSFRAAQSWAVNRVLQKTNTLLVMPTGAGKSVCYMVPAVLLPGLTVVVSPLISLMQDQIKKLPVYLPGVCLSGELSANEMAKVTAAVLKGSIKVLFVSPERLCTHSFRALIRNLHNRQGPQAVSLLCVDEAHCMSSWSYNFRPAFLRIRREISLLQPGAILALTATAPPYIQRDIFAHLGIPADGINIAPYSRPKLRLHGAITLNEEHRRQMVLTLLQSESSDLRKVAPTIVYVWRRMDAESTADFLRAAGIAASPYHAGMDTESRRKTQLAFDRGTIHVICGTVSFGMGVDKSDVRRVIHCCLPKSVESYLQETGRAGRDGEGADCHLLISKDDFITQSSLAHSSRLSRLQLSLLLTTLFPTTIMPDGKCISLSSSLLALTGEIEHRLDVSPVATESILSLLELPPHNVVRIEAVGFDTVRGMLHLPPQQKEDPLLNGIIRVNKIKDQRLPKLSPSLHPGDLLNGMGGSDYGLGLSEPTGQTNYGRLEFEASLFELSSVTGLQRDEITRGLYHLQRSGVVREYTLYENALYVSLLLANSENKRIFSSGADYMAWIDSLSESILAQLLDMERLESQRIVDTWCLGNVLSVYAHTERSIDTGLDSEDAQCEISKFLSEYMQSAASYVRKQHTFSSSISESTLAAYRNDLVLPLTFREEEVEDAFIGLVAKDVYVLESDPKLKAFIADLIKLRHKQATRLKATPSNMKQEVIDAKAICIANVMHGLVSFAFPLATWKDNASWARFRHISYDYLLEAVTSLLCRKDSQ